MRQGTQSIGILAAGVASLIARVVVPVQARAHCDTLDGPVVKEASVSLRYGARDTQFNLNCVSGLGRSVKGEGSV